MTIICFVYICFYSRVVTYLIINTTGAPLVNRQMSNHNYGFFQSIGLLVVVICQASGDLTKLMWYRTTIKYDLHLSKYEPYPIKPK